MKFALVHLSGSHRGKTEYFDRSFLSLGSDPANDVRFPAGGRSPVAPLQAEVFQRDCDVRLRNREPEAATLVNHTPVAEVVLHDGDVIQLGPNGPKLRFRIRPEEYAACKLVREMLQDARDVASEARLDGRRAMWSFFGQLAYDLRRHASWATQLVVIGLLMLLVGLVGGLAYFSYATQLAHERHIAALLSELESTRLTQAELERRTAEERQRIAGALANRQSEIDRLVARLEAQQRSGASRADVRALRKRLQAIEIQHTSAERLIRKYGSSVCFLYLAYGFIEKGKPGDLPSVLKEYMGTGFLVDIRGLLTMNRHIMEPWSVDPSGTEMVKAGMEPKLVALLAYFPGRQEASTVSVFRVSDVADVALGQLSPVPEGIEPIPIVTPAPQGVAGEPVVLLGYPAGIEGVLARMDDQMAQALITRPGRDLRRLLRDVAAEGGIRPLATQGHVGDIFPNPILYGAPPTGGGSGSPVFNSRGQIIGVHVASMTRFGASNFGVPISTVVDLLTASP